MLAAILAFAFGAAPQWLASVWSLFSSEPLFMWAARQSFLPQLAFSVSWLTWPISIGLLVAIFVVSRTGKRAELTPFSTKISRINGGYNLAVGVKNTGNRKAIDAQITTVFWRCSGQRKPFAIRKSNANPISKDVLEQVELDFTIEPLEPVFVVMSFAYRSRERGKLKEQHPPFYYKWNGSDSSLVHASKEERDRIIRRLKNRDTVPPAIEFQGDFEQKSEVREEKTLVSTQQERPLSGISLRNQCDKWIESGRSIHARLARGERDAITDAKKWLDGLLAFSEINLSIADFDKIHNSNTSGETFHREMAKLNPSHEVIMHERLLAYRIGRFIEFRNKMK